MILHLKLDTDKLLAKLSAFGITVEGYEQKKKRVSAKFVKPTVEEVRGYMREVTCPVEAEVFMDFYESKNWYVGKNKMVDWKAAVRTWKRKHEEKYGKTRKPQRAVEADIEDILARAEREE